MAVKGSATVTLTQYRDIQSVTRYYKLQTAGSSAPSKPETKPPSSDWTDSEPACDISKELYFCDLTIFSNGEGEYSSVSKSSSYEAAKEAYNKAQSASDTASAAQDSIDNLEIGGRNLLLNTADNTYYPAPSTDSVYNSNSTSGYPNQNIVCTADGVNNSAYRYFWLGGNTGINLWKYLSVNLDYLIKHNKYLTFSVEIKTTGKLINPYISLSMRINNSKVYNITAVKKDGLDDGIWRRYEVTKDMSSALAETYTLILFIVGWDKSEEEGSTLEWRNLKLEIGNKATDWTPAPEDVDAGIKNAAKTATNYIHVDSTNGLVLGNKESGSWVGYRTKIDSDSFNVLDENGDIIASYGSNEVELGKGNSDAIIKMCDSKAYVKNYIVGSQNLSVFCGQDVTVIGEWEGASESYALFKQGFASIGQSSSYIRFSNETDNKNYIEIQGQNITMRRVTNVGDFNCYMDANFNGNTRISGQFQVVNLAGEIKMWAGDAIPDGWLLCDGSEVSKTDYPVLYGAIGDLWGVPSSSSNFKLPNLAGKVPVGYDSADTDFAPVGHTGGEKTHKLTITEMPAHTHSRNYYSSDWCANGSKSGYHGNDAGSNRVTGSTGGNGAHNNLQPYAVVKYIICAF